MPTNDEYVQRITECLDGAESALRSAKTRANHNMGEGDCSVADSVSLRSRAWSDVAHAYNETANTYLRLLELLKRDES